MNGMNGHDMDDDLSDYFKRNMKPVRQKEWDDTPFVVSTRARVIRVPAAHPGRAQPWVTFDIAKDPRVDVPLDGLITIPPDQIHETSSVKGEREDEPEGRLVVKRNYAARKGWV